MLLRALATALATALVAAGPASAATRTETDTAGQVTANFTYDYKKTQFGTYDFANLHVTIDRAGVRLVDASLEDEQCDGCASWPAGQAAPGTRSVTVRDLDT